MNEYYAQWYAKNKHKRIIAKRGRRHELKRWYDELRSTLKCEKCGESHIACLDFHHLSDKDKPVSLMVAQGYSKKKILAEIEKCIVLCANCHRKEHWTSSTLVGAGIL